ncbi:MAG: hypothetical protein ABWZ63_08465, partial [Thermoleophilaceae bacterium]
MARDRPDGEITVDVPPRACGASSTSWSGRTSSTTHRRSRLGGPSPGGPDDGTRLVHAAAIDDGTLQQDRF